HLLNQLAQHNFDQITPDLRKNILAFYSDPAAPLATEKKSKDWQKTQDELEKLRALPEPAPPATKPTSELNLDDAAPSAFSGLDSTDTLVTFQH
ncbi:MAG: hypothetical protein WBW38_08010, partial [Candidatus Sulfotelmatobacter sp.]